MAANGGLEKEFVEERVAFTVDPEKPEQFLPRILVSKSVDRIGRARVEKTFRQFQTDDINRVLDFENVDDPPPDGPMMHCENETDFPSRHFALRGGFLFYFGFLFLHTVVVGLTKHLFGSFLFITFPTFLLSINAPRTKAPDLAKYGPAAKHHLQTH